MIYSFGFRVATTTIKAEAATQKGVLKNLTKFTGERVCQSWDLQLYEKKTLKQLPSCEFCEICKNNFFYRIPPANYFCVKG